MKSFWSKQNVLVTGVSGFLAPHIFSQLEKRGANVIGTIHDDKKVSYLSLTSQKPSNIARVDIADINRLKEVISNYEVNFIFHCAANSIVKNCATNPIGCFKTNIIGTANVLEAARLVGGVKGILCMESDKSYGSFDIKDLPYKEHQAIKPKNVYEVSKACSGLIAESYAHNYSLPVFTVRAANLYGPGDMNLSRLIPGSILRLLNNESPLLYSGVSDYVREFLYVEDAASALISLMEICDKLKGEVINLGSGEIYKIKDVVTLLIDLINPHITPVLVEKNLIFKEIELQYLDITKFKSYIKNYQPTSLKVGINNTVSWYKKYIQQIPVPANT